MGADNRSTLKVQAWELLLIVIIIHPALLLVAPLGLDPVPACWAGALALGVYGGMPMPRTALACNRSQHSQTLSHCPSVVLA